MHVWPVYQLHVVSLTASKFNCTASLVLETPVRCAVFATSSAAFVELALEKTIWGTVQCGQADAPHDA